MSDEGKPAEDYFALAKRARGLKPKAGDRVARLAILADCSTQHVSELLKVLAADRGITLEIYQAPFDAIELEINDPGAELYRFAPDFTVILSQTEQLLAGPLARDDADVEAILARMTTVWDRFAEKISTTLIQGTFVQPAARGFGNFERLAPSSLGERVIALNDGLARAARERANVLLLDVDFLSGELGRKAWRDEKLWYLAKAPCSFEAMPILARNIIDIVAAGLGRVVKCLVLDLDNTLWGGVIGDDGLEGIALGELAEGEAFVAFQRYILALKRRGIILAVCSKNDHANAVLPFERHPDMVLKLSDIAVFRANWDDKAANIRHIQETLNIGLDSMVFLDDNPFERSLVRGLLPQVIVPELPEDPALYVPAIAALNLFETVSFSKTDLERADLYRVEAVRSELKAKFESVEDYLTSLEMTILLEPFTAFNLPRIAQLIQRSNQFNLMTRRYGEGDCARLMRESDAYHPFTLTLADRFGGYGLISVIVLRLLPDEIEIDEYLMSCRVLQRGVENFAMNYIFDLARARGAKRVVGRYAPTAKNAMVRDFYAQFGFARVATEADGATRWELAVESYVERPALMTRLAQAADEGVVAA